MIVWSIANQKGGVGKTTTAMTLAGLLSQQGKRVLLVDTDPHASLTTYLGLDPDHLSASLFDLFLLTEFTEQTVSPFIHPTTLDYVDVIPAHMSLATLDRTMGNRRGMGLILKRTLATLQHRYDYVLIDCPPVLGIMMVNALAASERTLIPVQTEFLAVKGLERMLSTLTMMQKSRQQEAFNVTIIPTMFDTRTPASLQTLRQLKKDYPTELWHSVIPNDTAFAESSFKRLPVTHLNEESRGVFAYQQLLKYLEGLSVDE